MSFPFSNDRFRVSKRTHEEEDEYFEKRSVSDFFPMLIAATITIVPVVLGILAAIYGVLWLFVLRG